MNHFLFDDDIPDENGNLENDTALSSELLAVFWSYERGRSMPSLLDNATKFCGYSYFYYYYDHMNHPGIYNN